MVSTKPMTALVLLDQPNGEKGETLIGLLVGLSVGLVVLAAGSALLAAHLRAHRSALQDSHLHADLRSAMDWMARELRKAQYTANAWATRSPSTCTDAFCDGSHNLRIDGDEIHFSHDRNHDGQRDSNECMGFRLSGTVLHAKRSCSASGDWQAITDKANLAITALRWQVHCNLQNGWLHRRIQMRMTAQWPGDASRPLSLSQTVHLRNDLPASQHAQLCP
jgi:type II secretory pathway component PulJ